MEGKVSYLFLLVIIAILTFTHAAIRGYFYVAGLPRSGAKTAKAHNFKRPPYNEGQIKGYTGKEVAALG